MARVKRQSRQLFLGAAFVCVMALTGALMGGIGGLILGLLTNIVLGMEASMLLMMPASAGVGALLAGALSIVLVARPSAPTLAWQPRVNVPVSSEGNVLH